MAEEKLALYNSISQSTSCKQYGLLSMCKTIYQSSIRCMKSLRLLHFHATSLWQIRATDYDFRELSTFSEQSNALSQKGYARFFYKLKKFSSVLDV